jgi:hypothetical protein
MGLFQVRFDDALHVTRGHRVKIENVGYGDTNGQVVGIHEA